VSDKPAETSGKQIAVSAAKLERSSERIEDTADRRTQLAADRTVFAAERTYAAWVRTGLVSLASGIGAKTLLAGLIPDWLIIATGSVLVAFSAFCFGAGVWRNVNPAPPPPTPDTQRIAPWLLMTINGFLVLVAVAVLIGIWVGKRSP
jgi:putative membrane protein